MKQKSVTLSTKQSSHITVPMAVPVDPNCERFISSMATAEQKTLRPPVMMTMADAL